MRDHPYNRPLPSHSHTAITPEPWFLTNSPGHTRRSHRPHLWHAPHLFVIFSYALFYCSFCTSPAVQIFSISLLVVDSFACFVPVQASCRRLLPALASGYTPHLIRNKLCYNKVKKTKRYGSCYRSAGMTGRRNVRTEERHNERILLQR